MRDLALYIRETEQSAPDAGLCTPHAWAWESQMGVGKLEPLLGSKWVLCQIPVLPVTWTTKQILPEACLLLLPMNPSAPTCLGTRLCDGGHLLRIPVDEAEMHGPMES